MFASLEKTWRKHRELMDLQSVQRIACDARKLRRLGDIDLKELFNSHEIEMAWNEVTGKIEEFAIPDGTGGVNPGDRKAIFHLISRLESSSVLEIGTHIGASTIHIASALYMNQIRTGRRARLVSVDIVDVNDPASKLLSKYGVKYSPGRMVNEMALASLVEFVQGTSLDYLARSRGEFDLIFLDGDHSAATVYQEICLALNLLREDGLILLHDYYPGLKPLWSDGLVVPGPYLAVERLRSEVASVVAYPLNELPWRTKLQSRLTSLAFLLRNE